MSKQKAISRWEFGYPDYLGKDAYLNIQAHIDDKILQHDLLNREESSKKKSSKTDIKSQKKEPIASFNLNVIKTEDDSQINEVPDIKSTIEKKEELTQAADLEIINIEKNTEDSDSVDVNSRRKSDWKTDVCEEQKPKSTNTN